MGSNHPYSETQAIIELGKLDYERHRQANQRCLDAGGCPECFCVAAEQGREHWGHCSKANNETVEEFDDEATRDFDSEFGKRVKAPWQEGDENEVKAWA